VLRATVAACVTHVAASSFVFERVSLHEPHGLASCTCWMIPFLIKRGFETHTIGGLGQNGRIDLRRPSRVHSHPTHALSYSIGQYVGEIATCCAKPGGSERGCSA
jgi:hypothetical protein